MFLTWNKAVKLPFFVIFAKKLYEACFERAWFSKSCARGVIDKLLKIMPAGWIIDHGCAFYSALLFIIRDLADAVAFGVVEDSVWKINVNLIGLIDHKATN